MEVYSGATCKGLGVEDRSGLCGYSGVSQPPWYIG